MKLLSRLFPVKRDVSLATVLERRRLTNSMPGETAALAANRLGMLVG
ncbi:MAG: hypothetical protein AB7I79_08970 [Rhizobiaceae bacterium]